MKSTSKTRTRKTATTATRTPRTRRTAAAKTDAPSEKKEFFPYDEEAWKWMAAPSIPGAYSPICYIGTKVSREIAAILGRPMTLEEAQYLVQPDGDTTACTYHQALNPPQDLEFQPVKYVYRVPPGLARLLTEGKKLIEVPLVCGGAYYFDKKTKKIAAFSGSVFRYDPRAGQDNRGDYVYCKGSPLVIAAEEAEKICGFRQWGSTSEEIKKIMGKLEERAERRSTINSLMAAFVQPGRIDPHEKRRVDRAVSKGGRRDRRSDDRNGKRVAELVKE